MSGGAVPGLADLMAEGGPPAADRKAAAARVVKRQLEQPEAAAPPSAHKRRNEVPSIEELAAESDEDDRDEEAKEPDVRDGLTGMQPDDVKRMLQEFNKSGTEHLKAVEAQVKEQRALLDELVKLNKRNVALAAKKADVRERVMALQGPGVVAFGQPTKRRLF
jgi:hypothetical protein